MMKTIKLDVAARNKLKSAGMFTSVIDGAVKADKTNKDRFEVKGVDFVLKKIRNILVIL